MEKFFKEINGETWLVEDERDNMKLHYRLKDVIFSKKSPYQQINIVDSYDFGRCLVLDGVIQTTELDGYIYNEMISHIPAVTHNEPEDVLVIGGGDCGVVNELIKYANLKNIDMIEIDRAVVEACVEYIPSISGEAPKDERVNFIFEDGIKFVKNKNKSYDIAIVDSSDPVGPAEILFSEEFYISLKKSLKDDGIMVCQSQSPIFHKEVLKKTRNILKKHFPIVRTYKAVVPSYPGGMWSFTLASLKYDPLTANIEKLNRNTKYINSEIFKSCFNLPNFMKQELE
ncbi:polyamine aminopropyltransferase [Paramaledivibacter caminithermalis]|jgi:spermidine synthase|uniref:Polyamine aminopropyltransferase n=1 Tax=Paramaledivibacter caminithermalis (strain DSM 15212 / CIP 107654 / DViRD3) TaxID=1121301 RepID=A0A1M6LE20_PARC5|nr:polyamine aminopropyltransferase [Paramaledivibacter caminithermalis]SHJ69325.1 spermidine synthase [Paramaledivibacter caminithermalis DSM 15212]